MKLHLCIIAFVLLTTLQLAGQPGEPDTIISEFPTAVDSLHIETEDRFHPADSLYGLVWNRTNITYTSAKLPAKKDTLMITLRTENGNKFTPPITGKVISGFGTARRPGHTGTDIKLNPGDTVRCAFDGKVRLAKRFSGYGNLALVRHNNGLETIYAHLSKLDIKEDQWVKVGDVIGLGGRTGRATTDHLHFEVRLLGIPINPEKLIDFSDGKLRCDTFYFHGSRMEYQLADFQKNKKQAPILLADGETITYSIQRGDTLSSIARKFGTTVKNICALNNISPQKILQIGTPLIIQQ